MVKCDNCGTENSSDAVRCKKCGESFDSKKGGSSNTKIIAIVVIIIVIAIVGVFASGIFTNNAPAQGNAQVSAPQQTPAANNTTSVDNNTTATSDSNSASSSSESSTYVASAKTDKFHRPDCEWAQKISGSNKITYSSRDQAIAAGKTPCSVCNP